MTAGCSGHDTACAGTMHIATRGDRSGQASTRLPSASYAASGTFVEHNVWSAFEHAYRTLRERSPRSMPLAQDLSLLRGPEGPGRVLPLSLAVLNWLNAWSPAASPDPHRAARFDPAPTRELPLDGLVVRSRGGGSAQGHAFRRTVELGSVWAGDDRLPAQLARPIRSDGHLILAFADRSSRRALALLAAAEASAGG